jgi:hypothetical protein
MNTAVKYPRNHLSHLMDVKAVIIKRYKNAVRVQKIIIFLNSAPTSTESALWLLSAPSVTF